VRGSVAFDVGGVDEFVWIKERKKEKRLPAKNQQNAMRHTQHSQSSLYLYRDKKPRAIRERHTAKIPPTFYYCTWCQVGERGSCPES
jgi:hypothetical protein